MTTTPKRRNGRCLRCGTSACTTDYKYDRELCLLLDERNQAGDALDAWHDGAVMSAMLAGVGDDEYQAGLEARYDRAKAALAAYTKGQ